MFIYPCEGRVSSAYRTSQRPDHYGVDFAQSGMVSIVAAAEGTVSRSYISTSYGEVIFLVHHIEGQIWETVYAHMRSGSRKVKQGDYVKQGEHVGDMGNTGQSTGQHLHFELHKGRWDLNKTNAVNPLAYLSEKIEEEESSMKLQKWQYEELAKTYEISYKKGILTSNKWHQKARKQDITIDEIAFLNAVIMGRLIK